MSRKKNINNFWTYDKWCNIDLEIDSCGICDSRVKLNSYLCRMWQVKTCIVWCLKKIGLLKSYNCITAVRIPLC